MADNDNKVQCADCWQWIKRDENHTLQAAGAAQSAASEETTMRCPNCNKFATYDDSTDPEIDVDLGDDGSFSGQVRIVLTHDECGEELKEASFDFDGEIPEELLKEHQGDGHALNLESGDNELTSRTEGKGRYMKTFYGYRVALDLSCSCQSEGLWLTEFTDDIQASHMDELV